MRHLLFGCLLLGAMPVRAQAPVGPPVIRVVGHGSVLTAPDVATLSFEVRGEGATADAATRALVATRGAIDGALSGRAQVRTGRLSIRAARDKACDDGDNDGVRLSSGACAIRGYIASLRFTAKVKAVAEAGTLLGVVAGLAATDPTLDDFALADPGAAGRAALAAAIRDATEQARAIAAASHVGLGRLRRVEDQRAAARAAQDIVVTASRVTPPVVSPPPIVVAIAPEPIETTATLVVEFDIGTSTP